MTRPRNRTPVILLALAALASQRVPAWAVVLGASVLGALVL